MKEYLLIVLLILEVFLFNVIGQEQITLPDEFGTTEAVNYSYFPSRQYTFIFRNWTVVPQEQLAKVLNTSVRNVQEIAYSMGLTPQVDLEEEWSTQKGYITVLRRNWQLLPYEQLLVLLDLSREELSFRLFEDDFLMVKLGNIKPQCPLLYYSKPSREDKLKAKQIAQWISKSVKATKINEEDRFSFIKPFLKQPTHHQTPLAQSNQDKLHLIYSYFASFGDPLMEEGIPSYPEALLKSLSESGINAIWIHSVLHTLVEPSGIFPGSKDAKIRLLRLQTLVDRAAKYGIKVYLYINEPRAMHESYFATMEEERLKGVREGDLTSLCTSLPEVRTWIKDSYVKIFKKTKGLAGAFTISASENLTNCASHNQHKQCENCKTRNYADIISEINCTIADGILEGNPEAHVIIWDWGWNDSFAEKIINKLPSNCTLMSVSEWNLPIDRGGIQSKVGEYSISAVGPGPRAIKHWRYAKARGMKTIAKIQVNSSWELAIIPSLPVLDLVAEHASSLEKEEMDGVMLSWSLGGYPSINLAVYQSPYLENKEAVLSDLANKYYTKDVQPLIRKAWTTFSEAFKEYPYNIWTLYHGPHHMGVANPLYLVPTHYKATMVGIPYDDLDGWRSIYPVDIYIQQMKKVATGFSLGAKLLSIAKETSKSEKEKKQLEIEEGRALAVSIHCFSSANQAIFTEARNQFYKTKVVEDKLQLLQTMQEVAQKEYQLTLKLLPIVCHDSAIGYESSNHYFYIPQDLLEKQINTKSILVETQEMISELAN